MKEIKERYRDPTPGDLELLRRLYRVVTDGSCYIIQRKFIRRFLFWEWWVWEEVGIYRLEPVREGVIPGVVKEFIQKEVEKDWGDYMGWRLI